MSFINLEQLPFVGMSHEFVGETQGAPFSAYIVNAKPGQGPPLHKHPYVEVAFTLEGCATITVGDEQREVKAGGIVVIPADTPHRFVNSGDTTLRQIDIHASPRFIQTNLTEESQIALASFSPEISNLEVGWLPSSHPRDPRNPRSNFYFLILTSSFLLLP